MWLAENWASLSNGTTTLTQPTRIRQEHREAAEPPIPPEASTFDTLLTDAAKVTGEERGILAKAAHAKSDTPEGRNARSMLKKQAEVLGMPPETLVETASVRSRSGSRS